jgi:chromosome segregation ATPase
MAKLINILAASIGGGVVLGAGIRMVERMAADRAELPGGAGELVGRLDSLEQRLVRVEGRSPFGSPSAHGAGENGGENPAAVDSAAAAEVAAAMDHAFASVQNRFNAQQAEVEAMRTQLASANLGIAHLNRKDEQLREELRGWVDENVRERLAAAETKLQRSIESAQKSTLDALVEGVQTRVILRISKLEEEVAGQSAAMAELRECSLSTERSMQKLLEGIDRLVATQVRPEANIEEHRVPASPPPATPAEDPGIREDAVSGGDAVEEKPNFRRWGLFR